MNKIECLILFLGSGIASMVASHPIIAGGFLVLAVGFGIAYGSKKLKELK